MHKRCNHNRKRSKRRAIYCPIHSCYLDSVSRKYKVTSDSSKLKNTCVSVPIKEEWLEAFWCPQCQKKNWYYVRQLDDGTYDVRSYPQGIRGINSPDPLCQ